MRRRATWSRGHTIPVPVFPACVACQDSVSVGILAFARIEIEATCTSVSFFAGINLGFREGIQDLNNPLLYTLLVLSI